MSEHGLRQPRTVRGTATPCRRMIARAPLVYGCIKSEPIFTIAGPAAISGCCSAESSDAGPAPTNSKTSNNNGVYGVARWFDAAACGGVAPRSFDSTVPIENMALSTVIDGNACARRVARVGVCLSFRGQWWQCWQCEKMGVDLVVQPREQAGYLQRSECESIFRHIQIKRMLPPLIKHCMS